MTARDSAAIGVFAALAYAGSFLLLAVPNATLAILLVFYSGFVLGRISGALVGFVSSVLITLFNPYGIPLLPLLGAQVLAYTAVGLSGGISRAFLPIANSGVYLVVLCLLGLLTALMYQVPVSLVDAWLFGPFWERLVMSGGFAIVTIVSNILFFAILFPVLAKLKKLSIFDSSHRFGTTDES